MSNRAAAALNKNYRVIATARRVETLAALEARGAKIMQFDVTASVGDMAALAKHAMAI